MAQLPPDQRLPSLVFGGTCSPDWAEPLLEVADKGSWTDEDAALLISLDKPQTTRRQKKEQREKAVKMLEVWANASEFEDGLAAAMKVYHDNFFAEEEMRILPALKSALVEAQELAAKLSLDDLMLNLSQGVLVTKRKDYQRLIMVPSFWSTPFMLFFPLDEASEIRVFGARPANASLVPGEVVPDALHQALKTLADPTRLKIFRYLSEEALSPAELARRLRLRPPTVIHHLSSLRLARLVQVTISYEGRRYSARPEAIEDVCAMLEDFVHKEG
jgi:DNA-binding transcriptional ArsR family regulator